MTTVKDLFGLTQVIARDMKTAIDRQPPDPTLIYGIELEIECASVSKRTAVTISPFELG